MSPEHVNLARQQGLRSIAFPAISTGLYKFDSKLASKIAFETTYKLSPSRSEHRK
jgi:O-acetyl-ADP-ribose deacetylase (regulator of RNase III)